MTQRLGFNGAEVICGLVCLSLPSVSLFVALMRLTHTKVNTFLLFFNRCSALTAADTLHLDLQCSLDCKYSNVNVRESKLERAYFNVDYFSLAVLHAGNNHCH